MLCNSVRETLFPSSNLTRPSNCLAVKKMAAKVMQINWIFLLLDLLQEYWS